MAFRKRRNRKRFPRRKFRRINRRKGKGDGVRYFKLRTALDAVTDVAGAMHYTWSLTSTVTSLVNINGAGPANSLEETSLIGGLFDNYMVRAIKIKFIPDYPNNLTATTTYKPMYVVFDRDTPNTAPPITSIAAAVQYDNLKVYNFYRQWKYYKVIPKFTEAAAPGVGWLDLANIPNYGCIDMYAPGLSASSTYGKFIVTYYVAVKNRR